MAQQTQFETTSDEDLLRRSAGGDQEAFLALYRRRQGALYRFAFNMSGSTTVAEEVTQEVFLALIRDSSRFEAERGSAVAYMFGTARNHVLRCLERDRRYVGMEDETSSALPSADPDPCLDLTRAETIQAVREAVLTLPAPYREAIVLCDLEEVSYNDAAAAMQVPVGTVRSRLNRGRSMLAERLRPGNSARATNAMRCFA